MLAPVDRASPAPVPTVPTMPAVDAARLWDSLMTLAAIGATPKGGVCRLALTELDRQARDLVSRWAREAGCTLREAAYRLAIERVAEAAAGRGVQ